MDCLWPNVGIQSSCWLRRVTAGPKGVSVAVDGGLRCGSPPFRLASAGHGGCTVPACFAASRTLPSTGWLPSGGWCAQSGLTLGHCEPINSSRHTVASQLRLAGSLAPLPPAGSACYGVSRRPLCSCLLRRVTAGPNSVSYPVDGGSSRCPPPFWLASACPGGCSVPTCFGELGTCLLPPFHPLGGAPAAAGVPRRARPGSRGTHESRPASRRRPSCGGRAVWHQTRAAVYPRTTVPAIDYHMSASLSCWRCWSC